MLYSNYSHGKFEDNHGKRKNAEVDCLGALVEKIDEKANSQAQISIEDILQVVGKRWYGPLLAVAGLIMMTPVIGDIPGVPVIMGLIVILVSLQLLINRKKRRVWLPSWILSRKMGSPKVKKAVKWIQPATKVIDKITRPRLSFIVRSAGLFIIAIMCMMLAAITPVLELIPFSANLAGSAIFAFGISVLARDGVIALLAIAFSLATFGVGGHFLLGI